MTRGAPVALMADILKLIDRRYEGPLTPDAWATLGSISMAVGELVEHLTLKAAVDDDVDDVCPYCGTTQEETSI